MATKSENRRINLYINGKEVQNNIKSIRSEYYKAINDLSKMTYGSKEYYAQAKEVKKLKGVLNDHAKNIGNIHSAWHNLKTKFGGWIAAGFGLTAAASIFNKFITSVKGFEKKASELSALTGLMGDDLKYLKDQALKMNSTFNDTGVNIKQSATDILDAFKIVGSAKPELLKDKEGLVEVTKQAIILSEAAQMELGPAVQALTLIMNQFGAPAKEASRFINVLAAGSKEGSAEVGDLSESIKEFGTVSNIANIGVEQSVALVEALAEKGLKGSRAGIGLRNVLLELLSGADDTNPKIVGMNTALENLAKKNLTAAQLTKLFGKENVVTANILIETRSRVNELNAAVSNTNTAYEQAAINTNNLQGKTESMSARWASLVLNVNEGNGIISTSFGWVIDKISQVIEGLEIINKYGWVGGKEKYIQAMNDDLEKQKKIMEEVTRQMNIANEITKQTGDTYKKHYEDRLSQMKAQSDMYQNNHEIEIKALEQILSKFKQLEDEDKKQLELKKKLEEEKKKLLEGGGGAGTKEPEMTDFEKAKEMLAKTVSDKEIGWIIEREKRKLEAYKEGREKNITDLEESFQKEANLRLIKHNEELAALGTDEGAKKALTAQFQKNELDRLIVHLNQVIAKAQEIIDDGGIEGLNIEQAMLTDEEKDNLIEKIEELKIKVSELQAEAVGTNTEVPEEQMGLFGMTQKKWDKLQENIMGCIAIAQQLGEIWATVNQRISDEENRNFANYEKNTDKRKDLLKDQLNKGLISQKKYNNEVATLDANLDAEKKKLEIEQAKRQRTQAVFSIIVNTALAVMQALGGQIPPYSYILAALSLAMGVAQLAALPPVPEYAEGGYTHGAKQYIAGEAGQEWIAPNWMTEHPYITPVLQDLERVRMGVAPESIFRQPVSAIQYTGDSTLDKESKSGSLSDNQLAKMIQQNEKIIEYNEALFKFFKDPQNRRAVIVYDDLAKSNDEINAMIIKSGF